jgi:hypothetical protein
MRMRDIGLLDTSKSPEVLHLGQCLKSCSTVRLREQSSISSASQMLQMLFPNRVVWPAPNTSGSGSIVQYTLPRQSCLWQYWTSHCA